jgi:hypothetical protein
MVATPSTMLPLGTIAFNYASLRHYCPLIQLAGHRLRQNNEFG